MRVTPMPQFLSSAEIYLSHREIHSLEERLLQNPRCGKPVQAASDTLRRVKHPDANRSDLGFRPVVVYMIHDASNEIILIDVIEDDSALTKMLRNPFTWVKIYSLFRAIRDAVENVL